VKVLAFLWRYFRRYTAWCVVAAIAVGLFAICTTIFAGLFQPLYSEVLGMGAPAAVASPAMAPVERSLDKGALARWSPKRLVERAYASAKSRLGIDENRVVVFLPLVFFAIFLIRGVFDIISTYAFQRIGLGATTDIRNDLQARLLAQSSRFHAVHPSGELVSRVANDVSQMQNAVSTGLMDLVQQGVTLVALVAMLVSSNARLSFFLLVAAPLLVYPIVRFGKGMRRTGHRSQERLADLSSLVAEAVRGHRVVKAFGMEGFENARFRAATARHLKVNLRGQLISALAGPVVEILGVAGAAVLLIYTGRSIRAGSMTPDSVWAFLTMVAMMYNPLRRLNKVNLVLQQSLAATERVMDLMGQDSEIREKPGALALPGFHEAVVYEGVTFGYERDPVVRDFDLTLRRGETVALVGPSGGGKSTVVNLLPRFFDPDEGRVTIDGIDVRDVKLADLRAQIGLVTQETTLFNDTVRNNIAYGRSDLPLERVREAAAAAYADEFITGFPQGYDTVVGESGLRLSGGQRQRLAIARAILKNAPILILDEATSQLDSESEALVQKALHNLMAGRTTLVIAHRLSTVMEADRIVVVEAGRIVEQGRHDELVARGGLYKRLYDLQFRGT
jgi:subfamily B ATP-binding cassette protein MsbA